MVLILLRLRSRCFNCGIANKASVAIIFISLLAKLSVCKAFNPTNTGNFVNWLWFNPSFSRFVKLPMLLSHRSSPKLLCGNSLKKKKRNNDQINRLIPTRQHGILPARLVRKRSQMAFYTYNSCTELGKRGTSFVPSFLHSIKYPRQEHLSGQNEEAATE